jgi:hypothetical protein
MAVPRAAGSLPAGSRRRLSASADAGIEVEGHAFYLCRRKSHCCRGNWTRRPDNVPSGRELDAVAPIRGRRDASTDDATPHECQHDAGSRLHAGHARHADRRRGRQEHRAANYSRRTGAGGSTAAGGKDARGEHRAPDPWTRKHMSSVAPKWRGRPREGPASRRASSSRYGAIRAMCVFQLPSSLRASG